MAFTGVNPPEWQPEIPLNEQQEFNDSREEVLLPLPQIEPGITFFDTETFRFRPGVQFPELVCVSTYDAAEGVQLRGPFDVSKYMGQHLVGHHIYYDLGVMAANYPDALPRIVRMFDEERIWDTKLRQQLIDISTGNYRYGPGYALDATYHRYFGVRPPKDRWRLTYSDFYGKPIEEMTHGAQIYTKNDAIAPAAIFMKQGGTKRVSGEHKVIVESEFWLTVDAAWGLRTDENFAKAYEAELIEQKEILHEFLSTTSPFLVDKYGKKSIKNTEQYIRDNHKIRRRTDKGNISLAEDALREYDDELLDAYAEYAKTVKKLGNDIHLAQRGFKEPIHTNYGLAGTLRTTTSPNFQNLNTKSKIRECFIARENHCFAFCDYGSLELHTFAQFILDAGGPGAMAELLNSGAKIHSMVAGAILGCSWQEVEEGYKTDPRLGNARQLAKACVYGKLGFMGDERFVLWCGKKGLKISILDSRKSSAAYTKICPDVSWFFGHIKGLEQNGIWKMEGHRGEGLRICRRASQAANTSFQRPAAFLARDAVCRVNREMYIENREVPSPLYGSRLPLFIHDELGAEVPIESATAAGERVRELMVQAGRTWCPDVPPSVSGPDLMVRWNKNYQSKRKENGELTIYGRD